MSLFALFASIEGILIPQGLSDCQVASCVGFSDFAVCAGVLLAGIAKIRRVGDLCQLEHLE